MTTTYNSPEENSPPTAWTRLITQYERLIRAWLFMVTLLFLFRSAFLAINHDLISRDSSGLDIFQALTQGLRFDISTAISWLAIPFLLSYSLLFVRSTGYMNFINKVFFRSFIFLSILLMIGTQIHFHYYGAPFDQRVMGLYYETTSDLMLMFWQDSHPIIYTTILLFFTYLLSKLLDAVVNLERHSILGFALKLKAYTLRTGFTVVFFIVVIIAGRGTVDGFPLSRNHANISKDTFLNEIVMPPHTALRYVLQDYFKTAQAASFKTFWPGSLASAINTAFPNGTNDQQPPDNIDNLLAKTTRGMNNTKPRHIFLFVMESYGGWTLLPKYRSLGLSEQLSQFADQGISIVPCDSASGSTGMSLTSILTSMPSVGFDTFSEITALKPYPSSLAETFHRLGYKTRFFHGAGLGWRNMDKFLKGQGFDEQYGVNHIGTPETIRHNWYVHDEYLYKYILEHLDDSQPTFNVILTISNHPPYDTDWRKMGYKLTSLPPHVAHHDDAVEKLGAFWYADQQLGKFIKAAEKKVPNALFAVTGDHKERLGITFPSNEPYANRIVPFVLYGKDVLKGVRAPANIHARHIDIGPTLYDLAADKGFQYYGMGDSIFDNPKNRPSYSAEQLSAMRALTLYRIKKGPIIQPH